MKRTIYLIALLLVFAACNKEITVREPKDYSSNLTNIAENVILKTYHELVIDAQTLHQSALALRGNPNTANIDKARIAWQRVRAPWEKAEGFINVPVHQAILDSAIDSWPVNRQHLENILDSSFALNPQLIRHQPPRLKGFHAIEYLLWGSNGNKLIADFNKREYDYIVAATKVLEEDIKALNALWVPDHGNHVSHLLTAGDGGYHLDGQRNVLKEIVSSLVLIADEVGNAKINRPLMQQDPNLEESTLSNNSKNDFANNIRSIKNIYTGYYDIHGSGTALGSIVQSQNKALNNTIVEQIDDAIDKIEAIPGTFSSAITNNPAKVSEAKDAVLLLKETLETELLPLIKGLR